jgi:hypothetical protein
MQIKLRYVHKDRSRHGKVRYYFRRAVGEQKHRLPGQPGDPEFHRAYHELFAETDPGTPKPVVSPAEPPVEPEALAGFLNVDQCRASLPIKISRREVVRYIKAAGPEFYQAHRRQLFLTPAQWMAVVQTMR